MIAYLIFLLFKVYEAFIFFRIMGSWFPSFRFSRWMQFLAYYTDPFLDIFRRMIPPIGGRVDLSPLLAFLTLDFLQKFLLRLFS